MVLIHWKQQGITFQETSKTKDLLFGVCAALRMRVHVKNRKGTEIVSILENNYQGKHRKADVACWVRPVASETVAVIIRLDSRHQQHWD